VTQITDLSDKEKQHTETRKEVARKLREVADQVENGKKVPTNVFLQIHWTDSEITTAKRSFSGMNVIQVIGALTAEIHEYNSRVSRSSV